MTITRNFKLYLNAGTASAPYINVNQYDEGEEWVFTLYNEDGSTYTPSSGAIIGIKSDGNAIMNAGSVVGGKVVITETEQMTAASGRAIFELLIDNATHGTANFIVNVERRPSDDAEFSDSDLSMLQEAINSAAEIEDLLDGQDVPTVITPIISDWLDENITNPSNPPIDTSLTVAGAAADAKKTGDEITDLKSAITTLNTTVFEYQEKTQATYITGTSIAASTHILDVNIKSGQFFELTVEDPDNIVNPNSSGNKSLAIYYLDSTDSRVQIGTQIIGNALSMYAPVNIKGFTAYRGANGITPSGNLITHCRYTTQSSDSSLEKRMSVAESDIDELQPPVNGTMRKSENLYDPENITVGTINSDGNANTNASYRYTDFIPVSQGDTLYFNCGNARMLCAYSSSKTVIGSAGEDAEFASGTYTVPANVAFVRITFTYANIPQYPVVNVGTALAEYEPFGKWYIRDDALPEQQTEDMAQVKSLLGETSATITAQSLTSQTLLKLDDAPWFIKKNHGITALAKFSEFTSVTVGKGYNNYRGKWIEVDGTNITPHSYESNAVVGTPIPHGLTISDFIQITMYVANDGKCRISINSLSGTFSTEINYMYEWNYAPFIIGSQAMTGVKLSYSCADLRSPLWLFGDSYMGIAVNRIGGQLKNLGYFNYLINAIAGGRAVDSGTPGKSASDDLDRMLEFSTPKFLIWTLGMNGGDNTNISYLPNLINLCEAKGINLILYMPPSIPSIDHSDLNEYIASTGIRYIDGNDAVGATTLGVWYTGYLSTDDIHPSTLGAKALAMRFLADAPELMQYGFSTGTVDSEIDGDEH